MSQAVNVSATLIADLKSTAATFAEFGTLQARADAVLYNAIASVAKVADKHERKDVIAAVAGKFTIREDTRKEAIIMKLAYGWETKTKIAQVSAWTKVLKVAKSEGIEPDGLVAWIERCGGIEAIRNGWYKDAEEAAPAPAENSAEPAQQDMASVDDAVSAEAVAVAPATDVPAAPAQDTSASTSDGETAENERKVLAAVAQFSDDAISELAKQQPVAPRARAFQLLNGRYTTPATIPQSLLKLEAEATNGVAFPLLRQNAAGDWDVIAVWTGGPTHTNSLTALGDFVQRLAKAENGQVEFFTLYAEEKAEAGEDVAAVADAVRSENASEQPDEGKYRSFIITDAADIIAARTEGQVAEQ
ncbi:hypothetical protein G6L85_12695 [Agrobacterium rhizogenes]|uniref:hypothetical protein n=1 Tax=Rhizobium rhizogenes TaxID=359 RepID=UPI001573C9EE|nr:hypothetical protein [Rhizobium rhizogenes]NTI62363.1 hypothetical protein [Rhizobium rhizogenes]